MFKIGVIGDEVSQDFQTVVNVSEEFNLDSIEIRSVWDKSPQELSRNDIDQMKRILGEINRAKQRRTIGFLTLFQLSFHFYYSNLAII